MRYSVYNQSGDILRTGSCQECDIDLQAGDGEFIYIGEADQLTQKVVDGELVSKEPEQILDPMREIRLDRNTLLAKSDWTQMPDSPLTQEQKQAWADYRQALRDLPQSNLDLDAVKWPQQPEV